MEKFKGFFTFNLLFYINPFIWTQQHTAFTQQDKAGDEALTKHDEDQHFIRSVFIVCPFLCVLLMGFNNFLRQQEKVPEKESTPATDQIGPVQCSNASSDTLEDVQALGWGVRLTISLPHEGTKTVHEEKQQRLILKADGKDQILFKESPWIGQWQGYVYTTIEHSGRLHSGYSLDKAFEPRDTFKGQKIGKRFGLKDGVGLGYHFDEKGVPPSADPASDQLLIKMGWGQSKPAATTTVVEETPETPKAVEAPQVEKQVQNATGVVSAGPPAERPKQHQFSFELPEKTKSPGENQVANVTSRRAAFNVLQRLRNNPERLKAVHPDLQARLLASPSIPSELTAQLQSLGNDLQVLNATFTQQRQRKQPGTKMSAP